MALVQSSEVYTLINPYVIIRSDNGSQTYIFVCHNYSFSFIIQGQSASTMTCIQLHKKAERIGAMLIDKAHLNTGDHVALIYPPGLDLIAAFYGCLYVG